MNTRVIIAILVVTNLATLFYAFNQKRAVGEQRELAVVAQQEALTQQEIAKQQRLIAESNAEEASRQTDMAMQLVQEAEARLADCK